MIWVLSLIFYAFMGGIAVTVAEAVESRDWSPTGYDRDTAVAIVIFVLWAPLCGMIAWEMLTQRAKQRIAREAA